MKIGHAIRSFTAKLPHLIFFVTGRCNARCDFCFYWRNLNRSRDELTLDEIERFARKTGHIPHLSLSGGEPFLRADLDGLVEIFYRLCSTRFVTIPTNGLLVERITQKAESMLAACPELRLSIVLSLDAVGEKHDAMRGVPGIFDRLCATHDSLVDLRRSQPRLRVFANTVVSAINQDTVEATLAFVREQLSVDRHTLAVARGDTKDPGATEIAPKRLEQLYAAPTPLGRGLFDRALEARARTVRALTLTVLAEQRQPIPCVAGRKLVVVSETGEVHACEILDRPLGDLRETDYDLHRILDSARAREVLASIAAGECHCTFECALADSVFYHPRGFAALAREMVRLRTASMRLPVHPPGTPD